MPAFRRFVPSTPAVLVVAGACFSLAGCATEKGLPSDRPFALSQYNAGQNETTTGGKSSAADLVTTPPPGAAAPSPTPAPASAPFQFNVTCIDEVEGKTYKSGEVGYDACLRRKAQATPRR